MSKEVKNYYQGIYLTETIMGNPNGDFVDNSPRNFDGKVFTTDKCIKYNIRRYIHEMVENLDQKENIVFFYPRQAADAEKSDAKYLTKDTVFKNIFEDDFNKLLENSPDVRMFGGTFSFKKDSKQIYGPIQLSYGKDFYHKKISDFSWNLYGMVQISEKPRVKKQILNCCFWSNSRTIELMEM